MLTGCKLIILMKAKKMINSNKITFQTFEAVEEGKFLPLNTKISLEYLDSNMDGIFENERSWRSFINGNFICEYDKSSWRDSCKPSTIKKWTYAEEEYKDRFVVQIGKDKYISVSPDDISLGYQFELYYNRSSGCSPFFPSAVELFVIATIKG